MPSSPEPVRYTCRRLSYAGIDDESALVLQIVSRGFFQDFGDARETRAPFQHGAKLGMLLRRGHREYFHATIPPIADETADAQLIGSGLGVKAIAHALDHAGDKIPFRLFRVTHKPTK